MKSPFDKVHEFFLFGLAEAHLVGREFEVIGMALLLENLLVRLLDSEFPSYVTVNAMYAGTINNV